MKAPLPKQRSLNPALPMVWLGLAVWGTVVMMSASNRPGPAGAPPARWPAESSLTRPVTKPTLIMFLEPNCVCSKASLGELSLLMDGCQGKLNARVLFIKAAGRSANWQQSDLWRQAMVIPGVGAAIDVDGREARLFGAQTSGEVVLYGADGRLLFQGGMTLYRGQSGSDRSAGVGRSRTIAGDTNPCVWLPAFHQQSGGTEVTLIFPPMIIIILAIVIGIVFAPFDYDYH
jgi:hypothetical protein